MNEDDRKLDEMLSQWANQRPAPTEALEKVRAMAHAELGAAGDVAPASRGAAWMGGRARQILAIAAVLLAAVSVTLFVRSPQKAVDDAVAMAEVDPFEAIVARARLDEVTRNQKGVLYGEMRALFPEQLKYIAESGDDVSVNLATQMASPSRTSTESPVLVRVVVASRELAGTSWEVHRTIDIMANASEVIDYQDTNADPCTIRFWALPLDSEHISLDLEMEIAGLSAEPVSASEVCRLGEAQSVLSGTRDGREFHVFQSVATITTST